MFTEKKKTPIKETMELFFFHLALSDHFWNPLTVLQEAPVKRSEGEKEGGKEDRAEAERRFFLFATYSVT